MENVDAAGCGHGHRHEHGVWKQMGMELIQRLTDPQGIEKLCSIHQVKCM